MVDLSAPSVEGDIEVNVGEKWELSLSEIARNMKLTTIKGRRRAKEGRHEVALGLVITAKKPDTSRGTVLSCRWNRGRVVGMLVGQTRVGVILQHLESISSQIILERLVPSRRHWYVN